MGRALRAVRAAFLGINECLSLLGRSFHFHPSLGVRSEMPLLPVTAGTIIQYVLDEITDSSTDLQCLNVGSNTVRLFGDFGQMTEASCTSVSSSIK